MTFFEKSRVEKLNEIVNKAIIIYDSYNAADWN